MDLNIIADAREHMNSMNALYRVWDVGQRIYDARDSTTFQDRIAFQRLGNIFRGLFGKKTGSRLDFGIKKVMQTSNRNNVENALDEMCVGNREVACYTSIAVTVPNSIRWVGETTDKKIIGGIGPDSLREEFVRRGGTIRAGPETLEEVTMMLEDAEGKTYERTRDAYFVPETGKWYKQTGDSQVLDLFEQGDWEKRFPHLSLDIFGEEWRQSSYKENIVSSFKKALEDNWKPFFTKINAGSGLDGYSYGFKDGIKYYGHPKRMDFEIHASNDQIFNLGPLSELFSRLLSPELINIAKEQHAEYVADPPEEAHEFNIDSMKLKLHALERAEAISKNS